jgi:hypothetical protein
MRETFMPVDPRFVYSICAFRQFHFLMFQDAAERTTDLCFSSKTSIHFNFLKAHALKQRGYGGARIGTSIGNDPAQRRFLKSIDTLFRSRYEAYFFSR